jgi:hypothetical protein
VPEDDAIFEAAVNLKRCLLQFLTCLSPIKMHSVHEEVRIRMSFEVSLEKERLSFGYTRYSP